MTAKVRQLIQFESSDLSTRELGRALNLAQGTVVKYRSAIRAARLTWEEAQTLSDRELERRIRRARVALKRPFVAGSVPAQVWATE
jgi:hypothetical protein